jgi:hypothetical protein
VCSQPYRFSVVIERGPWLTRSVGQIIMNMNALSDNPSSTVTLLIHAVGISLLIAAFYLLGLTVTSICSSFLKFSGAAIVFFGCDALAWEGWRLWNQWRSRKPTRAS